MYIIKKNFKEENSIYLGDYIPMTKIEAQDLTDRLNRNTSDNLLYQFEKMPDFTDWVDIYEETFDTRDINSQVNFLHRLFSKHKVKKV